MARPASDGVHRVDDRGHLRLPSAVRRWCRLLAGDRMLFAADAARGVLTAYPLAVLDRLLAGCTPLWRGRTAMSQPESGRPELAAARLMLERMGISPADLMQVRPQLA